MLSIAAPGSSWVDQVVGLRFEGKRHENNNTLTGRIRGGLLPWLPMVVYPGEMIFSILTLSVIISFGLAC